MGSVIFSLPPPIFVFVLNTVIHVSSVSLVCVISSNSIVTVGLKSKWLESEFKEITISR